MKRKLNKKLIIKQSCWKWIKFIKNYGITIIKWKIIKLINWNEN